MNARAGPPLAGVWRALWLTLAGTALLLLAIFADRMPTVFTDTDDYYSQGIELWQAAKVDWFGFAPQPETRNAADKAQAVIDAELSRTQMSARSTSYSLFLYGFESAGTLWLLAAVQGAGAAWTLLLLLRSAVSRAGPRAYLLMMAALATGSTLPFFAGFAMPDVFAGIGVACVALVVLYWQGLSRHERWGVALLLSFALVVHTSHELLAIVLVPVGAALLWWLREGWRQAGLRLGVVAGAIVLAIGVNSAYGLVVEKQTGEKLRHQPFLMARMLADGPGRDYLRHACAAGEPYALCRFRNLPLDDSEDILWSDLPTTGVFLIANYATRVQLELEEPRFVLGTLAYAPFGQLKASAANWWQQLLLVRVDDPVRNPHYYITDDYWAKTYLPDMIMAVAHCGRRGDQCALRLTPAFSAWWHGSIALAALIVSGIALIPLLRRRDAETRRLLALAALIVSAVFFNAGITGVLSGPFARYQSRLVWLLPALAAVALTRRALDGQSLGQLNARLGQRLEHAE